jgi:salicylate hydroxylase
MDAVDGAELASMPVGEAFRARFGNPHAVIHRADIHLSLLEGVRPNPGIEVVTGTHVEHVEQPARRVTARTLDGRSFEADALVAADGGKWLYGWHPQLCLYDR